MAIVHSLIFDFLEDLETGTAAPSSPLMGIHCMAGFDRLDLVILAED